MVFARLCLLLFCARGAEANNNLGTYPSQANGIMLTQPPSLPSSTWPAGIGLDDWVMSMELKLLDGKERFKRGANRGERRWIIRDATRKAAGRRRNGRQALARRLRLVRRRNRRCDANDVAARRERVVAPVRARIAELATRLGEAGEEGEDDGDARRSEL